MASPTESGILDPTKPAKYPVILSDALRGDTTTEIFTGIRYNHKPHNLSPDTNAQLRPAVPGSSSAGYELAYSSPAGKFAYAGQRATDNGQFVLFFDPARRAFILDRVDSVFHMNITRTPDTTDPDSLRRQFEQLDPSDFAGGRPSSSSSRRKTKPGRGEQQEEPREDDNEELELERELARETERERRLGRAPLASRKEKDKQKAPPSAKPPSKPPPPKREQPLKSENRKPHEKKPHEKKPAKKAGGLHLPGLMPGQHAADSSGTPSGARSGPPRSKPVLPTMPATQSPRAHRPHSEDEEEDSDGDLLVEYPDAPKKASSTPASQFSPIPAQVQIRRFSDFVRESTEDDAEGETDDEPGLAAFKLPSPAGQSDGGGQRYYAGNGTTAEEPEELYGGVGNNGGGGGDMEIDLEAELEAELEADEEADEESEVSEED